MNLFDIILFNRLNKLSKFEKIRKNIVDDNFNYVCVCYIYFINFYRFFYLNYIVVGIIVDFK